MFYIWSSISDFCDYINFASRAQDMLAPSKRQLLNQKEQTPAWNTKCFPQKKKSHISHEGFTQAELWFHHLKVATDHLQR